MEKDFVASVIAGIITGGFQLLGNHLGKPEGWKPTPQDIQDFLDSVDKDTPEAMKQEARHRLGLENPS